MPFLFFSRGVMHLLLLLVVLGAHYACTINTLVDIEQVYAIFGIPRDDCSEKEGIAKLTDAAR
jgi:hypothetical protein